MRQIDDASGARSAGALLVERVPQLRRVRRLAASKQRPRQRASAFSRRDNGISRAVGGAPTAAGPFANQRSVSSAGSDRVAQLGDAVRAESGNDIKQRLRRRSSVRARSRDDAPTRRSPRAASALRSSAPRRRRCDAMSSSIAVALDAVSPESAETRRRVRATVAQSRRRTLATHAANASLSRYAPDETIVRRSPLAMKLTRRKREIGGHAARIVPLERRRAKGWPHAARPANVGRRLLSIHLAQRGIDANGDDALRFLVAATCERVARQRIAPQLTRGRLKITQEVARRAIIRTRRVGPGHRRTFTSARRRGLCARILVARPPYRAIPSWPVFRRRIERDAPR